MNPGKIGLYSLSTQFIQIIIGIGTLAILGRMISLDDFGLFAIVLSVQAIFLPILDLGLVQAYLKLKHVDQEVGNAFFTVHALIGFIVAIVFVIIAPQIAYFFDDDRLHDLLTVVSLSFVFGVLGNQSNAKLNRDLNFKLIYKINIYISVTSSLLVIALAYYGYGIWSFIYRVVFEAAIKSILFTLLSKDKYIFVGMSTIKKYKESLYFGAHVVVSRLLSSWSGVIDKFILAKMGSTEVLAGYSRSQQLAQIPHSNISMSLTSPALAYVSRGSDFISKYVLLYWVIFLAAGIPCIILIGFGDVLFPLIMGENWESMGWLLQLMGIFGLGRVFQGLLIFFNINEKIPKRSSYFTLGHLLLVILPSAVTFIVLNNLLYFVLCISIGSFFYWYTSLCYATVNCYPDFKREILSLFASQLLILLVTIAITQNSRTYFDELGVFNLLIVGVPGQIILVIAMVFILNKNIINRLLNFLN
jgi:O-antigen/teichoic acid export membrane protein